jgi:hypothetical protein
MRVFRNGPAAWVLAAAVVVAAPGAALAQAETILSCQLSVDDGTPVSPPATLFLRVSPGTYEDFRDGDWGRNFCGPHGGGEAPDAECFINQGAFRVDWVWKSNVGKLERHVLLDLRSGELTDSDHNGLERKGVCKPASDPSVQSSATQSSAKLSPAKLSPASPSTANQSQINASPVKPPAHP